ncbi:hypothetical protein OG689_27785 [Kitasatospora sp. NBC_00240]|uniref:hypothetical protein n=1 Tax=Kitasatospora sp. NBC_00240 TaxID=2903567 RepID=UPI00225678DF|nr:hypothetical protein [Kitasatospora sp. NBC_00240]MCX5213026.1 hypothetical protein [Kitasatospora sp. NBC_00240]
MTHQLRAEYGPQGRSGGVRTWHIMRTVGATEAMCGRTIDPDAETRPEDDWGRTERPACQQCGSLYLHEVPHGSGDPHR